MVGGWNHSLICCDSVFTSVFNPDKFAIDKWRETGITSKKSYTCK